MSLPDCCADFHRGNAHCPRPFVGDSSGRSTVVPDHCSGIYQGGMSPPIAIPIVSLSGGTHPAVDAVGVRPLVFASFPRQDHHLVMQADRGSTIGGRVNSSASTSECRRLRPSPGVAGQCASMRKQPGGWHQASSRTRGGACGVSRVAEKGRSFFHLDGLSTNILGASGQGSAWILAHNAVQGPTVSTFWIKKLIEASRTHQGRRPRPASDL
jgi:hypothetical protein